MNAVAPLPATVRGAFEANLSMFDLAFWKPLSHERYVSAMAGIGFSLADDEPIMTRVQDLPDRRVRTVTYANVRRLGASEELGLQPYLLCLFDPDDGKEGKSVTFHRSDVELIEN